MNFTFTPDQTQELPLTVPNFEDARSGFAPYYSSQMTEAEAKADIIAEMGKVGAGVTRIVDGTFGIGKQKRLGYEVHFLLYGKPGIIRVAGLPIGKTMTERKREQVKVQALLNVRDWIKTSITQQVFSPGLHPLVMKLLADDGSRTLEEMLVAEDGRLPMLEGGI